jgi:formate hydrogenlyase subunit 3/multisubunit Na+/H+ antiporter MnhD subunit
MAAAYGGGALAVAARRPRAARAITAAGAVAGSAAALAVAAIVLVTGTPVSAAFPSLVAPAGGILLVLDRLGALFLALIGAIGVIAGGYGFSYTAEYDGRRSLGAFGTMFNAFLFGMALVVCAGNVFTFLLAWELMAVTSYFLVMTESEVVETRQAGLWYAAMTHLGLVLLLPMFLLLAPSASATTFADLRAGAAGLPSAARHAAFLLALAAFGSKAGLVPLHVWLPRAHPAAPSHVSALMSGVMIKLGVYGFVRVVLDVLGGGPAWWGGLVLVVGSVSALGGILYALADDDLKRLLAYSSVENVGIVFLGLGAGLVLQSYGLPALASAGFAAALLHAVNHACFKSLLFLGAGSVVSQTHTGNMERLGGLVKGMPQTAACFVVGAAAAAALPPLNGFASEWLIFQALLSGGQVPQPGGAIGTPLAVGVLALASGLAAVAFVKAFGITFLAMPRSDAAAAARDPHGSARAAMAVLAVGCVALGLGAPGLADALHAAVTSTFAPHPSGASAASSLWLAAPGGLAQVSPLVIAVLLLAAAAIAFAAVRAGRLRLRRADTWGCGRIRQTPRMEYTSSAFAEPLRRIFSEIYRPTQDLSVSVHPDSRYVVRAITYRSTVVPWLEHALYAPVTRSVRAAATRVRRLQAGSVHLYLLYVVAALLAALAAAWWIE